jgi:DNA-binding NarL/FixJ family response regulator
MVMDAIRGKILRLAHGDFHEFAPAAVRVLRRAVPFDAVALVAFDPATALAVDSWSDGIELDDADLEQFRQLAASGRPAARTSEGDELLAVCAGETGVWGAILMRREPGAPSFTTRDVDLLASLSGGQAEVQRARLQLSADADDRDPGLLLLDDEDGVEMANAGAAAWLADLPDGERPLPLVVTAVAERARAIASGHSDVAATARVRTASGRWVLVSGSVLRNGTRARTAVMLERVRGPELAEIIANAHGLTARERCVTRLVAQGLPTAAIAGRLHLSSYTIQDHLKAIFEKLGVSSRGELVARLFLDRQPVGAS